MSFLNICTIYCRKSGNGHIKIYGGGGGVILPFEIKELMDYGITRIYSPDDGRELGLQGMINDLVEGCDFPSGDNRDFGIDKIRTKDVNSIARLISAVENNPEAVSELAKQIHQEAKKIDVPVVGITGTGGAGKSSLEDELIRRFIEDSDDKTIAIISVDPSKRKNWWCFARR